MELTSANTHWSSHEVYFTLIAISIVLILISVIIFLKYAIRREKYSKFLPMKRLKFLDVRGTVHNVRNCARYKKLSLNVYVLQMVAGSHKLFEKEPFVCVWVSYTPFLGITSAAAAEQLIGGSKNMEKSSLYDFLHHWLGSGLLTSHGKKWKSRRKLLTPAFHFDILKDFLPVFNQQSQILVKLLQKETNKPWIDIITPVTLCSLDIICETTLGATVNAQENSESEYVKAVQRVSEGVMDRLTNPFHWIDWYYYNISKAGKQEKKDLSLLHDFTLSIIAQKKRKLLSRGEEIVTKQKRKALMDLLLDLHIQNQSLTEEDIREEVDTFTFEGHDTTSMGMCWALYLIGLYTDIQENIHGELDRIYGDDLDRPITTDDLRDMEYLERVLKESQRLYPSVPAIGRKLDHDIILCGTKIPKDVHCVILTYCLHRDESVYPNPEKFDPDRFLPENSLTRHPFAYIPFSAGPRNCIGQRFAMMEEKVVIANILRNYTIESLDHRDIVLPASELILRSVGPIRMKLKSRKS